MGVRGGSTGGTNGSKSRNGQCKRTELDEVTACGICRAARHGQHLLKHSFNKHQGQVPLAIRLTRPEDVHKAARLLRSHGFEVTYPVLAMSGRGSRPAAR